MADLEAAGGSDGRGGGDPSKQVAVLQRLVQVSFSLLFFSFLFSSFFPLPLRLQAASQCPSDVQAHLGDILKVTYFQTGVRALRTLSYSLLAQCREAWPETSGDWDNVVGSAMKDVETPDADLQCAAVKALSFVPVAKMIVHLERARINLPNCLSSGYPAVRRQACVTMGHLLLEKFSEKQLASFGPLWVPPMTRLLWTDGEIVVASAAALFLVQVPASGPLFDAVAAEFAATPSSFFLVSERVKSLTTDPLIAPMLVPLARVAQRLGAPAADWLSLNVLVPRLGEPYPRVVVVEAARALQLIGDHKTVFQASVALLDVSPRLADWALPLPLDVAMRTMASFVRSSVRVALLSQCFSAYMGRGAESSVIHALEVDSHASPETMMAAVLAARRSKNLSAAQACFGLASGWPKSLAKSAVLELGGKCDSADLSPTALAFVEPAVVGYWVAAGASVSLWQENEIVRARAELKKAVWTRVSPDSSAMEVECSHALAGETCLVAVRLRNMTLLRLGNVRLSMSIAQNATFSSAAVQQHFLPELAPNQVVSYVFSFVVKLPFTSALSFAPLIVFLPATVATSSSALSGRAFACSVYAASIK